MFVDRCYCEGDLSPVAISSYYNEIPTVASQPWNDKKDFLKRGSLFDMEQSNCGLYKPAYPLAQSLPRDFSLLKVISLLFLSLNLAPALLKVK